MAHPLLVVTAGGGQRGRELEPMRVACLSGFGATPEEKAWKALEAEGEAKIIEFPGGLYAVTQCKGIDNIGKAWKQLLTWWNTRKTPSSRLNFHVPPCGK